MADCLEHSEDDQKLPEVVDCHALCQFFELQPATKLDLSTRKIKDVSAQQCLASHVASAAHLRHVDMESTVCNVDGMSLLLEALLSNKGCSLQTISLRRMGLPSKFGAPLGRLLAQHSTLITFDVSHNALGTEGVAHIIEPLLTMEKCSLQMLNLSHNNVTNVNFQTLETVLTLHRALQINLLGNPIKSPPRPPPTTLNEPPKLVCKSPRQEDLRNGTLVKPTPSSPSAFRPVPLKIKGMTSPSGAEEDDADSTSASKCSGFDGTDKIAAKYAYAEQNSDSDEPVNVGRPVPQQRMDDSRQRVTVVRGEPNTRRSRSAPTGRGAVKTVVVSRVERLPDESQLAAEEKRRAEEEENRKAAAAQIAAQQAVITHLQTERDTLRQDLTLTSSMLREVIRERDALRRERPLPSSVDGKLDLLRTLDPMAADTVSRDIHAHLDRVLQALQPGRTSPRRPEPIHSPRVVGTYRVSPRIATPRGTGTSPTSGRRVQETAEWTGTPARRQEEHESSASMPYTSTPTTTIVRTTNVNVPSLSFNSQMSTHRSSISSSSHHHPSSATSSASWLETNSSATAQAVSAPAMSSPAGTPREASGLGPASWRAQVGRTFSSIQYRSGLLNHRGHDAGQSSAVYTGSTAASSDSRRTRSMPVTGVSSTSRNTAGTRRSEHVTAPWQSSIHYADSHLPNVITQHRQLY